MDIKNKKGITLVALVITIVVLLMLAGVSIVILDNGIIDKAVTASNVTVEEMLKEKIEMALAACEMAYWDEIGGFSYQNKEICLSTTKIASKDTMVSSQSKYDSKKIEYFKVNFPNYLEEIEGFENVVVDFDNVQKDSNEFSIINFKYKDHEYTFSTLTNGEVKYGMSLKSRLKIGDYIEYPIEYDDIYSREHYTSQTGWRVIDDGAESGIIKIISAGIPLKWTYKFSEYGSNQQAVDSLINNFENMSFLNANTDTVLGNYFKKENIEDKVTTITLSELNYAYNVLNNTERPSNDITALNNVDDLFINDLEKYYWLATAGECANEIYYINDGFIDSFVVDGYRIGIRPVIYLKSDLSGTQESGVWKIIN